MKQHSTFSQGRDPERQADDRRASLAQRLWRNQLGIYLAAALTIAALSILVLTRQG